MKQLSDYILVIPNAIPEDVIKAIYHEYIFSNEWTPAAIKNGVDTKIRNCSTIGISFNSIIEKNKLMKMYIFKNFTQIIFNLSLLSLLKPTN